MRIVVPVSRTDLHLLPEFVEIHQHLRTAGLNHSLHFVVPQPIESEVHDAKATLLGLFESITIHTMDSEPYGGWPVAPNMHFWACAYFMAHENANLPWQLVELDCRPLRANAYDVIAAKYASCGAPFFGNVSKTPWRTDAGKITKSLHGDGDVMMSGCAVYPGNLMTRPNFTGLMADFMKGESSIDVPWDMHLRSAMVHDGVAHTELIGQLWNTENYRVVNGRLLCDSRKEHEIFDQHPEWERRECGGPVHPDALMVHGCKDETLFRLIVGNQIPDTFGLPTVVAQPAPAETSATPAPSSADARIDRLEAMMIKLMEMSKPSAAPDAARGEPVRSEPSRDHETKASAEPLLDRVLAALPETGSKAMLSKLSAKLNTKKDALKSVIEASDKFTIKGPAEWVERIAA